MKRTALLVSLVLLAALRCSAQDAVIRYDRIGGGHDGLLLAATVFPGEERVFYTVRFTPSAPCLLTGALVMFGAVRFQEGTGPDTLELLVYEHEPARRVLRNVGATTLAALGDSGFPCGNVNTQSPLTSRVWDLLTVPFAQPIPIAPQRDFLIAVALRSRQSMAVGTGFWNGFAVMIDPYNSSYQRSGRYAIAPDSTDTRLAFATEGAYASVALRALVRYDSTLRDTVLAGAAAPAAPPASGPALGAPWPEPAAAGALLPVVLAAPCRATLTLYDALGRPRATLLDADLPAGTHAVAVPAGLPPGVYIAQLRAGGAVATRRITRTR